MMTVKRQIDKKKVWGIVQLVILLIGLIIVTFMMDRVPPVSVQSITPATALDDLYRPVEATDEFSPEDTFFVSVELKGYRPKQNVYARWLYDGQVITETPLKTDTQGEGHAGFVLLNQDERWPAGRYTIEVWFEDELLDSATFNVR